MNRKKKILISVFFLIGFSLSLLFLTLMIGVITGQSGASIGAGATIGVGTILTCYNGWRVIQGFASRGSGVRIPSVPPN